MVDDSGEAEPADGTPPSAPTAPTPPIAATPAEPTALEAPPAEAPTAFVEPSAAVEPVEIAVSPVTALPPEPSVGEPLPPAVEGDRREAVEGGAPAAVEATPEPTPDTAPSVEPAPALNEAAPVLDPAPADVIAVAELVPVAAATADAVSVSDPPPFTGEGDRRQVVEGAATATAPAHAPIEKAPPTPRTLPPILEFTAWRLLELVATVAVAAILIALLIRGETSADPAILADRLGVTVPLVILALVMAALVGLPIGYISARAGAWVDVGLRALTTIGLSLNPVWLAMLLVLVLAFGLQWLQPGGFIPWSNPLGALTSLLLPALALGLPLAADIASRMRDAFATILGGPAMRTADVRGHSRAEAIRDFALRHALSQTFARLAVPLALLVPLSLVIEAVFYLPGLGRLIFTALSERDFATLQLGLVTLVALVALCRFLGHLLQAAFDPRVARRV